MAEHIFNRNKPRVMLIPDIMLWILGTWAREIVKWNSDKFEFIIFPFGEIQENKGLFLSVLQQVDAVHILSPGEFSRVTDLVRYEKNSNAMIISSIHHIDARTDVESCLKADKIMVVCRKHLDELIQKGVPKEKIVLIYNGVDTDFFSPKDKPESRKTLGISSQAFTIGFSGKSSSNHGGRKGLDVFLGVLAQLPSRLDSEVDLILTGPGWDGILKDVSTSDVRVCYFPFLKRAQMPGFYIALDVFLVTSRVEGGPVPLLEAMSCGTPVITTPVGTACDFVEDGINGLVVPIGDVEGTVNAIEKVYHNKKLAERLGSAGRQTIIKNLQWKNTVSRIERLYGNGINLKNRSPESRTKITSFSKLNDRLIKKDIKRWKKQYGLESKWCRIYKFVLIPFFRLKRILRKGLRKAHIWFTLRAGA